MYALSVNLFALFFTDIVMIRLFRMLYGSGGYGLVPMVFLISMETMRFLFTWARMYMLLFLFCTWYLYIHARLLQRNWQKADLFQMAVCIFLGTLTHYYFYVYAGVLTILAVTFLIWHRRVRELLRYIYFGIVGIMVSWIFYPWALFHVFVNEQNKHAVLERWSLERGKAYMVFLRDALLDDRAWGWVIMLLFCCAGIFLRRRIMEKGTEKKGWRQVFRRMVVGSGLMYSLIIYTLDGDNLYYMTPLYMAFIVWAAMLVLDLSMQIRIPVEKSIVKIGMAVIGVWMVCSGSVVGRYLINAEKVVSCMNENLPLADDFRQTPERFHNYNCLYIEKKRDNLFHNYWFEFGQYRLFKKISLEQFNLQGVRREDLYGCEQGGDGIIVYAPGECEMDEKEYRWIAGDASYHIYEYVGGLVRHGSCRG